MKLRLGSLLSEVCADVGLRFYEEQKFEGRNPSFYRYLCLLPAYLLFQEKTTCTSATHLKGRVRFSATKSRAGSVSMPPDDGSHIMEEGQIKGRASENVA